MTSSADAVDGAEQVIAQALAKVPADARSLFQSGGPFELGAAAVRGTTLPVFVTAPDSLGGIYSRAASYADDCFFVYEQERYSFGDALHQADRVASGLRARGLRQGDRVGIAMRNYPEWIWSFMGVTTVGCVAVALNAWWTGEELKYAIEDSGLTTLFVDRERYEHLAPYLAELDLDVIVVRSEQLPVAGVTHWSDFVGSAELNDGAPSLGRVRPDDPAVIIYTSGSTSHPKGAVSSHRAIIHALYGWDAAAAVSRTLRGRSLTPGGRKAMLLTVPLFHVTGLNVQLLNSFRARRKLVGMYKWDAEKALSLIEAERITHFNGVPTMTYELMRSENFHKYDLSSLATVGGGGAPMTRAHTKSISERSAGKMSPGAGYGMTETNGLGASIGGADLIEHPDSCGRAVRPLVNITITDESGAPVDVGETGEIRICGAMNFSGYWNRPEATQETLVDGCVVTGDVGRLDADGFLYITDRLKDMVIRGGENIGCQEVEAALLEHADVEECVVFGVPHVRLGETLAAAVKLSENSRSLGVDLRNFVTERLARFKVPEHIWVQHQELPRIASGKLYKRSIREQAIAALASDQATNLIFASSTGDGEESPSPAAQPTSKA